MIILYIVYENLDKFRFSIKKDIFFYFSSRSTGGNFQVLLKFKLYKIRKWFLVLRV